MNVLLIDKALPPSIHSGKTVRLKNIYGRLAEEMRVIYVRTAQVGQVKESEELELWSKRTFYQTLRMPPLPSTPLMYRLKNAMALKPAYDLLSKYPYLSKTIFHNLYRIAAFYDIQLVITFDLEVAQYGMLLGEYYPWLQDLGDSTVLQTRRMQQKAPSRWKHLSLFLRGCRETPFERRMAQNAAATIFVAGDDASLYGREAHVEVIPNGIDADYFDPNAVTAAPGTPPYLIFTGHMAEYPNQDAARYFCEEIFPYVRRRLPELTLKIVGAEPSESVRRLTMHPNVEVTGTVGDMRPYLAGARAFVCPMRVGSGIKNKMLEAMAMRLPVVATPVAAAGFSNLPPDLVPVARDARSFADAVVRTVEDEKKSLIAGERGRNFVREHYAWDETLRRYRDLIYGIPRKKEQRSA